MYCKMSKGENNIYRYCGDVMHDIKRGHFFIFFIFQIPSNETIKQNLPAKQITPCVRFLLTVGSKWNQATLMDFQVLGV